MIVLAVLLSACSLPSDSPATGGGSGSAASSDPDKVYATTAQVLQAVAAAQTVQAVPPTLAPTLAKSDQVKATGFFDCGSADNVADADVYGQCFYGDPKATKTMAIYGDSSADMWAATLQNVAKAKGWKLLVYAKHACPPPDLEFLSTQTKTPNDKCTQFHATAPEAVIARKPDLIIVSSFIDWVLADGSNPTPQQWQDGLAATLKKFSGTKTAFISDVPSWPGNDARCLAKNLDNVQACSIAASEKQNDNLAAEKAAADGAGALYIPTMPWVCAEKCEPIIADTLVYNDDTHITQSYADYLSGAMGEALAPVMG